ncbi:MAG TPA: GYF domain-containing protein [Polyangiaceae bacterium]|nr:GYF domain-containing protein [Polyangiaceae bacterium]
MDDDSRALDKGWETLTEYGSGANEADEAVTVTVSISTAPSEWLVNTTDSVVVPMSMAEVVDALRTHKLNDRSLVWRNGMQEWQPVERVPQLTLAARLPSVAPKAPPVPTVGAPTPSQAPLRSSRTHTAPQSFAARDSAPPQTLPSPRVTLPGLPPPSRAQRSSPRNAAISRPPIPRAAVPPPARNDEADVLAVYERPAATISFELAPQEPPRSAPPSVKAPHTLAPTTTDHAPRRAADLSVVAASQFRDVQRSSKRLIWLSSLGSAAVASLLTLWISSSSGPERGAAAGRSSADLAQLEPAPARPAAPAVPPAPPVAAEPSAAAPAAETKAADTTASKPKAKRRARTWPRVAPTPAPPTPTESSTPSGEPNPYDVKLEEDAAPAPKSSPPATDAPAAPSEPDGKATGSSGF